MIASYIGRWSQAQLEQVRLCETIDQLSKRLPVYDVDAFEHIAVELRTALARFHDFEERELFPLLEAISAPVRPLLATFRKHHARDRKDANVLADRLLDTARLNGDDLKALKLRLEAFTESLRRHVQFEEAITMALFASRHVSDKRAIQ